MRKMEDRAENKLENMVKAYRNYMMIRPIAKEMECMLFGIHAKTEPGSVCKVCMVKSTTGKIHK